ncbi:hypothetical protein GGS20DRAFT_563212 [Poronia punctata]|nr:hypothetical protein GGS20DRAFT_563212 [Poronia punctata]
MNPNQHEAPEVATHQNNYPEVYYPAPTPEVFRYPGGQGDSNNTHNTHNNNNYASFPLNSFNETATVTDASKASYHASSPYSRYGAQPPEDVFPSPGQRREGNRRTICGRAVNLVLVLSVATALLSIAVIGLAAGTGVQSNRANSAESKLATLLANISNIDRGCSADPDAVTATRYTSQYFDRPTFKIYCNSDAPNSPLQTLFVGNFNDCMDACASYTTFTPGNFPNISRSSNFTCSGVSFIPAWTNRTTALELDAPGNCYLKPGPQNTTALTHPNGDGDAVHAAILQDS